MGDDFPVSLAAIGDASYQSVFKHVLRQMQRTMLGVPIPELFSWEYALRAISVVYLSKAGNLIFRSLLYFKLVSLKKKIPSLPFPPPPPLINFNLNRMYYICYYLVINLLLKNRPATLGAHLYH